VDETLGIPVASPADFPPVLHPEGLRFPGVLLRVARPLAAPYHLRSEKTRDEELKKQGKSEIVKRLFFGS
jgi:hypothetical protein